MALDQLESGLLENREQSNCLSLEAIFEELFVRKETSEIKLHKKGGTKVNEFAGEKMEQLQRCRGKRAPYSLEPPASPETLLKC